MTQEPKSNWENELDNTFEDCEWYGSGSSHEIKMFIKNLLSLQRQQILEAVEKLKEDYITLEIKAYDDNDSGEASSLYYKQKGVEKVIDIIKNI